MAETFKNAPLVSVVVITYNSSKYVLETLESIKNQTYKNIELVISDDRSTDETVAVCQEWVEENKQRFVRTEIVEVEKNTGVAPNCNRGLRASKGEWVKVIAGDDIIFSDGISSYIKHINKYPLSTVVVSDLRLFGDRHGRLKMNDNANRMSLKQQLESCLLRVNNRPPLLGPSGFYKRNVMLDVGGYDERFPMIEDYPVTLRLIASSIRINVLNEVCVGYRIHGDSISTSDDFSSQFLEMYAACALPLLRSKKMYMAMFDFYVNRAASRFSKKCFLGRLFFRLLKASSPVFWKKKFFRSEPGPQIL